MTQSMRSRYFCPVTGAIKDTFSEYSVQRYCNDEQSIHIVHDASDEKKCVEVPILVTFFLRYLIRNYVFPEEEEGLSRALRLCDLARKELPGTWVLSRSLPDKFSKGLQELHGVMTHGKYARGIEVTEDDELQTEHQMDALRDLCKDDPTVQVINPDEFEAESTAHGDSVEGNGDSDGVGSVVSNWGNAVYADGDQWFTPPKNELFEFLGPTTLPLTHTTGIVERSTRRIERVVRPAAAGIPRSQQDKSSIPSQADAVEEELERRLGYAVLTPWVKVGNHVASDLVPPEILFNSRGAVIVPTLTKSDMMNHGVANSKRTPPEELERDGPHPPFDPTKDAVNVLLDTALLNTFEKYIGMGICATWVQIARVEEPEDRAREAAGLKKCEATKRPRGAPGKNGKPTPWWYVEQVGFTLTSFHTDRYYEDQE